MQHSSPKKFYHRCSTPFYIRNLFLENVFVCNKCIPKQTVAASSSNIRTTVTSWCSTAGQRAISLHRKHRLGFTTHKSDPWLNFKLRCSFDSRRAGETGCYRAWGGTVHFALRPNKLQTRGRLTLDWQIDKLGGMRSSTRWMKSSIGWTHQCNGL